MWANIFLPEGILDYTLEGLLAYLPAGSSASFSLSLHNKKQSTNWIAWT
jgi:hypothetical protein